MGAILKDFFYQTGDESKYTRIVNRFLFDEIHGLKQEGEFLNLEDSFYTIINSLIEYKEAITELKELDFFIEEYNHKRELVYECRGNMEKQDYSMLHKLYYSGEDEDYKEYDSFAEKKRDLTEELELINFKLGSFAARKEFLQKRVKEISTDLEPVYTKLISMYDPDDVDKIYLGINNEGVNHLTSVLTRELNSEEEGEYLATETYKVVLSELHYYNLLFSQLNQLFFEELDDRKYEELVEFRNKMTDIRDMNSLKRDLLEHIFNIEHAQKDRVILKNKNRSNPSKIMIDYASKYLDAVNNNSLDNLTKRRFDSMYDELLHTSLKESEYPYVVRLLTPYNKTLKRNMEKAEPKKIYMGK